MQQPDAASASSVSRQGLKALDQFQYSVVHYKRNGVEAVSVDSLYHETNIHLRREKPEVTLLVMESLFSVAIFPYTQCRLLPYSSPLRLDFASK